MSTRALYNFIDDTDTYTVYKHHDGYPSGAIDWIENALMFAWELPRFEANEFSAAFIRANKNHEGGIRLVNRPIGNNYSDTEYQYEITYSKELWKSLMIKIFQGNPTDNKLIFEGTLEQCKQFVKEKEND
jgi:hypothetical protein